MRDAGQYYSINDDDDDFVAPWSTDDCCFSRWEIWTEKKNIILRWHGCRLHSHVSCKSRFSGWISSHVCISIQCKSIHMLWEVPSLDSGDCGRTENKRRRNLRSIFHNGLSSFAPLPTTPQVGYFIKRSLYSNSFLLQPSPFVQEIITTILLRHGRSRTVERVEKKK